MVILGATVLTMAGGAWLHLRAESQVRRVTLASQPQPVTVVQTRAGRWRARRRYVGRIEPRNEARIGPQFVSAYVRSVRVRPGARVRRGEVLASLDCRHRSAAREARAMRLRALGTRRDALADETRRYQAMLKQRYVAELETAQREARSVRADAELLEARASLQGVELEEQDCVLRAPFAGEVGERLVDPGAFVRPGQAVVEVVDRGSVRVTAEVPEGDFSLVAPGTPVRMSLHATGARLDGKVARRSPSAHLATRTVHIEIDLKDGHALPVGTTAELLVEAGLSTPAALVPMRAAMVQGHRAKLFVVRDHVATVARVSVLGERAGHLYLAPTVAAGALVVVEGRSLLQEGDTVAEKVEAWRVDALPGDEGSAALRPPVRGSP